MQDQSYTVGADHDVVSEPGDSQVTRAVDVKGKGPADSVLSYPPGMTSEAGAGSAEKMRTTTVMAPPESSFVREAEPVKRRTMSLSARPFDGGPPGGDSDGGSDGGDGSSGGYGPPRDGDPHASRGVPQMPPGLSGALGVGQLKLEAPPRYKGSRFPGVRRFLTDVERWMRLMRYPRDMYVDIIATRCEGGPQLWINNSQRDISAGLRSDWADYAEFREEFIRTFEPTTDAELARQNLEGFKQTGKVASYVTRFRELVGVIRDMSDSEKYRAFMKGLKPHIRQYVGPNVRGDLDAAILMAEQFDLYGSPESSSQGGSRNQGNQGKKGEKQKKGTIHVVEVQPAPAASSSGQVQAVESKKKQNNPQQGGKKGKKGKKQNQGGRGPPTCACCGGQHYLRECTEFADMRQKCKKIN